MVVVPRWRRGLCRGCDGRIVGNEKDEISHKPSKVCALVLSHPGKPLVFSRLFFRRFKFFPFPLRRSVSLHFEPLSHVIRTKEVSLHIFSYKKGKKGRAYGP